MTGSQIINLSKNGCVYKGTVVHELMHAIGFYHEQNRPDRNQYIKVAYENILSGKTFVCSIFKMISIVLI